MVLSQVTQSTITTGVWNNFLSIMKANVNSVSGAGSKTITIKKHYASFPDELAESKSNYPLLIISSPDFNFTPVTFRNRQVEGTIDIEILTTQSEGADKFKDLINYSLLQNEDSLIAVGIEELQLNDTASDQYNRGKLSVHSRKVVWGFKFYF